MRLVSGNPLSLTFLRTIRGALLVAAVGIVLDPSRLISAPLDARTECGACLSDRIQTSPKLPIQGSRRVLIIRVDFPDLRGSPIGEKAQAIDLFHRSGGVRDFFEQSSYGQLSIALTESDITDVLRMPNNSFEYVADRETLRRDAEDAASAQGLMPEAYDHVILVFHEIGYETIGQAERGGRAIWLDGAFSLTLVAHELGHNLGLPHANLWTRPSPGSDWSDGTESEYGDRLDMMGFGRDLGHHFNPWFKHQLGWIPDASVVSISQSGRYRVFRFDHPAARLNDPAHPLALRIPRGAEMEFWIGYRQDKTDTQGIEVDGAYVISARYPGAPSLLLNMRPANEGGANAYLRAGEEFVDAERHVSIQVRGRGGTPPNEYLDVDVELLPSIPLDGSLDLAKQTWQTGGDSEWFGSPLVSHDQRHSARSGFASDGRDSWLTTSVSGPAILSFWWKVSSDAGRDILRFSLDGIDSIQISGNVPWHQRAISIPDGGHIATWTYSKDGFGNAGADAGWLDEVTLSEGSVQISQTISFEIPVLSLADPLQVQATASSQLPVSFVVTSGPADMAGDWVVPAGTGLVTVRALQAGDARYAPAAPVDRTFFAEVPARSAWAANISDVEFANDSDRPPRVNCLALQADGKVIIGGEFTKVSGVPRLNLARFHVSGNLDFDWNPGTDGPVHAILARDGFLCVAGDFHAINDIPRNYLAKVSMEAGAAVDTRWDPDPDRRVFALAADQTHLFVAGYFSSIGGQERQYIAKLNLTERGDADPLWAVRRQPFNLPVFHLALAEGNLFLGGLSLGFNGERHSGLLRVSTDRAEVFQSPRIEFGDVTALAAAADGVYAAGTFTQIDEVAVRFLARIRTENGRIEPIGNFSANVRADISTLIAQGTNLYAGGRIFHLKGPDPIYLARFSTITRDWDREWDAHANGTVRGMALRGNDLFVAGEFSGIGGKADVKLALLPVLDGPPSVTPAVTERDQQTRSGLVIQPHPSDRAETSYYRIRRVAGGRLYKGDGRTELIRGDFISRAEGAAGLRFTPDPGFVGMATFEFSATVRHADPILGSAPSPAQIFVLPPDRAGLQAMRVAEKVRLIWTSAAGPRQLESAKDLAPGLWAPVQLNPTRIHNFETLELDLQTDRQFFRLRE